MNELSKPKDIEKKLEELLEKLFAQNDEDIVTLRRPELPSLYGNCCSQSYGSYSYRP